jgi:hypothetical protein
MAAIIVTERHLRTRMRGGTGRGQRSERKDASRRGHVAFACGAVKGQIDALTRFFA